MIKQQPQNQDQLNDLDNHLEDFNEEYEEYEEGEDYEELEESDLEQLPSFDAVITVMQKIIQNKAKPNEILTVQNQIDQLKINQIKKFYPAIMQLTSDKIIVVLYAFSKHFYAFSFKQQRQLYQLFEHLLTVNLSEQDETFLSATLIQFMQTKFQGYKVSQSDENFSINILMFKKLIKYLILNNQVSNQNYKILETVYRNLPEFMKKQIIQNLIKQLTFFISMNQKGKAVGLFTTKTKSQKQAKQETVENKLLSLQTFNFYKICWLFANSMENFIFPLTDISLEVLMMLELKPNSYCFILQLMNVINQNTKFFTPLFQFYLRILDFILQQLPTSCLQINLKIYSNKLFNSDGQQVKSDLVIVPAQFPDTLLYKTYLFDMWSESLLKYLNKILQIRQEVFPEATNAFLYQLNLIINNFYGNKMNYKEFQRGTVKNIVNQLKEVKKMITEGKPGKYQSINDDALMINLLQKEQKQQQQQQNQGVQKLTQDKKFQQQSSEVNNEDHDIIKPLVL